MTVAIPFPAVRSIVTCRPCLTNLAVAAERGFAASYFDDEDEFVSDGFDDGGAPDLSDWD